MFLKSAGTLLVLLYFVSYLIRSPRFIPSLHFIPGLQSAFYTWSLFYTWSAVRSPPFILNKSQTKLDLQFNPLHVISHGTDIFRASN